MRNRKAIFAAIIGFGTLMLTSACSVNVKQISTINATSIPSTAYIGDTLDNYLKSSDYTVTLTYSDNSWTSYKYTDGLEDKFNLFLTDPDNTTRSIKDVFHKVGNWRFITEYKNYSQIRYEVGIQVKDNTGVIKVDSVTVSPKSTTMFVGDTKTLSATVLPQNATGKSVKWISSNSNIVTVDSDGEITAVKEGDAIIYANSLDGSNKSGSCNVAVEAKPVTDIKVTSITLSDQSKTLEIGNKIKLSATVLPSNATNKKVTWSSTNETIASVDQDGNVQALVGGKATIKATADDGSGVVGTCEVTVNAPTVIKVTNITVNASIKTLNVGQNVQLTAVVTPTNAANKNVTWSSLNTSVATVNNSGIVNAVSVGSAVIKATAVDGSGVSGQITITVEDTPVTDYEEYTFTTKAWGDSSNAWTSNKDGSSYMSDKNGVQISTGSTGAGATSKKTYDIVSKVTFTYCTNASNGVGSIKIYSGTKQVGEASLTKTGGTTLRTVSIVPSDFASGSKLKFVVSCTTNSIYINKIRIDVGEPVYPTDIALSMSSTNIAIGETSQINVTYTPAETTYKHLSWSSNNSAVAIVDANGEVNGVSEGNATITCVANTQSSTITKTINVTVSAVHVVSISCTSSKTLTVNETFTLTPTFNPSNATNKNVSYSSSSSTVASVDSNGLVTANSVGNATITITSQDGNKTATCSVTVEKAPEIAKTEIKETYNDYIDKNAYTLSNCPTTGSPKLLIVPVWFKDSSNYIKTDTNKANVRDDIRKTYLGTNEETGWRSVTTFYQEESGNKLNITGVVDDWFECGYYSTSCSQSNTESIGNAAVSNYFKKSGADSRKSFDTDSNGYLDGVILIYGAPDSQVKSGNKNLWAYCYWLQGSSSYSTPTANVFFWASYDFMYSSSKASSRAGSSYGSGDTSHANIDCHTFVHEMGHVLGLEDYYDYSYNYSPAGNFSMQDCNVGGHDAYSVMSCGWANPYIPTSTCTITLNPFQSSKELILLTPSWNSLNSAFDEYMLLELYTPTGLNELDCTYQYDGRQKGPSSTGIRLWHVDARLVVASGQSFAKTIYSGIGSRSGVYHVMSNTYYSLEAESYISPLGQDYADYNLLQLIKKDTSATYYPDSNDYISNSDLFTNGTTFNMTTYKNQFVQSGKLNSGKSLGWTFSVSISGSGATAKATVTCTKA